jgi:3-oxoacyl-[acyl-carrier protein] reductase
VIAVLGHDDDAGHDGTGDGGGGETATLIAQGLRDGGAVVQTMACGLTGAQVAAALAGAEERWGPLEAVVLASTGREETSAGELAGLDAAQWRERVEIPLQRTMACFQGSYRQLAARGGTLVVLVPTLGLVGAAGYVPWATVAEGQRSLAKSAARVWGRQGIRVHCVAVTGAVLAASTNGGQPVNDRPGQPAPALPTPPDLRGGVAPVVAALVSRVWAGVTGVTVAVDGGVWMTP